MPACVFIPDYESWVFQRAEGFRGPLVAVAGGHVVAANKSARRAGIEAGITEARAAVLCPDVAIRVRDRQLELAVWEDCLLRMHETSPFLESSAPPFAWLDPGEPTALKALVRGLGVSAGIASHRSIAQLAALRAAPGNTLVVRDEHIRAFLARFEIRELAALGFEAELLERLELLGYPTLQKAAALSRRHLNAQFGDEGERLHGLLHPEPSRPIPLFSLPPFIERMYDCDAPCSEPGELWPVVEHLIDAAGAELGAQRCQRVGLTFWCRGESEPRRRSRILPEPAGNPKTLRNAARLLLFALLTERLEVEQVTLRLGTLKNPAPRQHTLFRQRPSVSAAVRAINKRFPGVLKRAVIQPGTLFLDEAVRFEPYPDKAA